MGRVSAPERTPTGIYSHGGAASAAADSLFAAGAGRATGRSGNCAGRSAFPMRKEATVDAFERAVELARERCAAGERLAEEIQRQEAVCAEAERHAQTERAALEQASADERAAMARWSAWFQTHGAGCAFARRGGGFLRPRGQRPDAACLGSSQAPGIGGAGGGSRRLARSVCALCFSRPFTPGMMTYGRRGGAERAESVS